MFIGHYSAAFVAAAHPKAPPLPALFVAAQLVDLGFFSLVLAGIEHLRIVPGFTAMNPMDLYDMPITHSLLGGFVWAAGFALILRVWRMNGVAALTGGAVVLSHWLLDVLVHAPDMSIAGGLPKFGLALWNKPFVEMPLELGLIMSSIWIYAGATRAAKASIAVPVTTALLVLLQMINWFGPQPQSVDTPTIISVYLGYAIATGLAWWLWRSRIAAA